MGSLFIPPFQQATNANGASVAGAMQYFYVTGTSTPTPVYTTDALTVEHANPVIADAAGRFASIYLDPDVTYRVVLTDALGTVIGEVDPYFAGPGGSGVLDSALAFYPDDFGTVGEGDDTIAINAALAAAAPVGGKLAGRGERWYLADEVRIPLGVVGVDGFNLRALATAAYFGLHKPGKRGLYKDGRDAQTTDDDVFVVRNIKLDAAQRPAIGIQCQNVVNIDISGVQSFNFGNPLSHSTPSLVYDTEGGVIDVGAYFGNDKEIASVRIDNVTLDGIPVGVLSAGNSGAGRMISIGGEAVPYPQPGENNPLPVDTARTENWWRQFGTALPTKRIANVTVTRCHAAKTETADGGGYYGLILSGVDNATVEGCSFANNIRSIYLQGISKIAIRSCVFAEYVSVAVIAVDECDDVEISDCVAGSTRVAGAAAFSFSRGVKRPKFVRNTFNTGLHTSAIDPEIAGALHKYHIWLACDIDAAIIDGNTFNGRSAIGDIGVFAATNVNPSGNPLHYATNDAAHVWNDMAHGDSSVASISNNVFNASQYNNSLPIQLGALNVDGHQYKLMVGAIRGNRVTSSNYSREYLRTDAQVADQIVITDYSNNPWAPRTTAANVNLTNAKVLTRKNNAGDPGSDAVQEGSVGSLPAPFPAGQIWFARDLAVGNRLAVSDGFDWRDNAGAVAVATSSVAAFTGTNITRTNNVFKKTAANPGVDDAGFYSTTAVGAAVDLENETIVHEGWYNYQGFTNAATTSVLSATRLEIGRSYSGELIGYQNGTIFKSIRLYAFTGDSITAKYVRATNRTTVTVNKRYSMETSIGALTATNAFHEFAVNTVGTDVTYAGVGRTAIATIPSITTFPVISGTQTVGSTLTITAGAASNSVDQTYQWIRGETPIVGANGPTYVLIAKDKTGYVDNTITPPQTSGQISCVVTYYGNATDSFAMALPDAKVIT